jgi:hypothetical protein
MNLLPYSQFVSVLRMITKMQFQIAMRILFQFLQSSLILMLALLSTLLLSQMQTLN